MGIASVACRSPALKGRWRCTLVDEADAAAATAASPPSFGPGLADLSPASSAAGTGDIDSAVSTSRQVLKDELVCFRGTTSVREAWSDVRQQPPSFLDRPMRRCPPARDCATQRKTYAPRVAYNVEESALEERGCGYIASPLSAAATMAVGLFAGQLSGGEGGLVS